MPISAILFGGRRASVVPLVFQSFDWDHGVFLGSIMASETTAAAAGAVGNLRRDPFAMLPFCGYNMADYFAHWLRDRGRAPTPTSCPRSSTSTGSARTPTASSCGPATARTPGCSSGCSSGSSGRGEAVETPIGYVPAPGAIDTEGLDVSKEDMDELLRVDADEWRAEVPLIREHFATVRRPPARRAGRRGRRPGAPARLTAAASGGAAARSGRPARQRRWRRARRLVM